MDVRVRIHHFWQRNQTLGGTQRVAGVRILEFDHGADITRGKQRHAGAGLAIQQIDLPDLLGAAPVSVVEFATELDRAGINAEKGQLAKLRLAHRFKYVEHRVGIGQRDFHRFAIGIGALHFLPVHRRGAIFGDEIHHSSHADVAFRRGTEQGREHLLLNSGVDAGAPFLLGETALRKEFFH